ncbi:MAG: CvpA family protein [Spirochaetaceae bacterium]|jgi:membrane protein required for colicin V production|nr:CvpA family protein [Spirochaetaceae bacterium]
MQRIAMLDIILLILMLIFIVRCTLQGFVKEVLSMTSWIGGILGAIFFFRQGAAFIRTKFFQDVPLLPEALAFSAVFFIIFLLIKVFETLIRDIVDEVHLGGVDHIMGTLIGVAEGFACAVLVLFLITIQPVFETEPIFKGSLFAEYFLPLIEEHIPANLGFPE